MCDPLRRLGDVYSHIQEIIYLPSNQMKVLDREMECSLELIDLCNTMQENFINLKIIIQDLQAALRRGNNMSIQAKIQSYTRLAKKAQKQFKKISKKTTSDEEDLKLVRLLIKARRITFSLLESTLGLLSKKVVVPKSSRVPKAFKKGRIVICKGEQLHALECTIGDLENGAELLFRRMIQSRVSLLNILTS